MEPIEKGTADTREQAPPKRGWVKRVVDLLPYAAALALGGAMLDVMMRRSVYANSAKKHLFDDIQADRDKVYSAVRNHTHPRMSNDTKINPDGVLHPATIIEAVEEKFRKHVRQAYTDPIEKGGLGYNHWGHYWKSQTRSQKIENSLAAVTVMSIVLGAAFELTSNRRLQEQLDELDRKRDAKNGLSSAYAR